ncbi:hypothetical protein PIB30_057530 [Stylosanthes scabra]|uniref:Extradiol ring-cleavage dioxygenase class III enzyme subunit B domain-containing protein n=1 Tax=Stylosanthes scabra TaxID=79078 RepID=A0ABU6TLS4_9FABA|nr:hypothetical protein [Stylosanthes scabra]
MNKIFRLCYTSSNSTPKKEMNRESGDSIDTTIEEVEENKNKDMNDVMGLKMRETFYISHGSPELAIDESIPAWKFLKSWKEVCPKRPSSILIVSGHWDTDVPTVNTVDHNDTIYDFYGFPRAMYKLKYPAPGAPKLAKRVKELLTSAGFDRVKEDRRRGLDHGAWVPLFLMYPEADIPVCQLSVSTGRGATYHYNMGKALAPLKDEGVLIIGSGSATHNLRAIAPRNTPPARWASAFMSWLKTSLLDGRYLIFSTGSTLLLIFSCICSCNKCFAILRWV